MSAIREMLQPGLTLADHALNSGQGRRRRRRRPGSSPLQTQHYNDDWCTALDPKHPVYNFLIEYYGLKGSKGPRRLARWSPNPALVYCNEECISSLDQVCVCQQDVNYDDCSHQHGPRTGGILLEGATEYDIGHVLHWRGATLVDATHGGGGGGGILYGPAFFFETHENQQKAASPYLWYKSVLQQTTRAEPVLHCHGLHEWAMQYHPDGAQPPPSAKYQSHLPLRVSRHVINDAVERRGISCTHVDALRYFAPAAAPWNHHGTSLQRTDQLRLEQPACVHAHMDLLKMALRLQPFLDSQVLQRVLHVALQARRLDVAASPYDASSYGIGVIPIETAQGRAEYRAQQSILMEQVTPVREELLRNYNLFLHMAFPDSVLHQAECQPSPERFAQAEPGGLPWRKNLIETTQYNTV